MMRLHVIAVGALKEPHWRAAAEEYLKRLRPYAAVTVTEIPDRDVTRDGERAVAVEGMGILKALDRLPGARVVALDLSGQQMSSEQLAAWIETKGVDGDSTIALVIGGADGLHADVIARADERLSLSRMTLPHQLARVVLLEQVYRAFRIMRGEPYHR